MKNNLSFYNLLWVFFAITWLNGFTQFSQKNPLSQPVGEKPNKAVIARLTGFMPLEDVANPTLNWATYMGGSVYDAGFGLALDAQGNTYVVGETTSSNIMTKNPYQASYGGGASDGFITKYSPTGELLWASYYGGTGLDVASAVCIDDNGNIYMSGRTNSNSGIAQNGYQNSPAGGLDAFMVKFNSEGQRLWGTYYGGTGDDYGNDMKVDSDGNIYIAGETGSSTGIAYNGFANTKSGTAGYLVKFNQNGERIWGTYYNGATYCRTVEVDYQNNVYLGGMTIQSTGMAYNGHQNQIGGYYDGFFVKFNGAGERLWATYYGGSNWDAIRDIVTDNEGNVFVSGETYSTNGIAFNGFKNSFQSSRNDWADGFIVKFNTQGVRQWGTYFGGPDHDGGFGIDTDEAGNLYLLTSMRSASGIAYKALQSTYGGAIMTLY
jgi:Beta-propeller repeat